MSAISRVEARNRSESGFSPRSRRSAGHEDLDSGATSAWVCNHRGQTGLPTRSWSATTCSAARSRSTCASTVEKLDLGTEVELTHQLTHDGSLALESERAEIKSFFGTGQGGQQELQLEILSSIVDRLNDRFGTDFTDADKLLFDQFEAEWVAASELSDQAQSNSIDNFSLAFQRKFMSTIVDRMDQNSEIFRRILDDDFKESVRDVYLKKVYEQLREPA